MTELTHTLATGPFLVRRGIDSHRAWIESKLGVVSREEMSASLLFHETVHTVQYRLLGVPEFARLYVKGFLATRSYHDIPLERCAFELESRFKLDWEPFRVESAVLNWMAEGRL